VEHSWNIRGTFVEHSWNIRGTFVEHSGAEGVGRGTHMQAYVGRRMQAYVGRRTVGYACGPSVWSVRVRVRPLIPSPMQPQEW